MCIFKLPGDTEPGRAAQKKTETHRGDASKSDCCTGTDKGWQGMRTAPGRRRGEPDAGQYQGCRAGVVITVRSEIDTVYAKISLGDAGVDLHHELSAPLLHAAKMTTIGWPTITRHVRAVSAKC